MLRRDDLDGERALRVVPHAECTHQLAPGLRLGPAVAVDGAVQDHGSHAAVAMGGGQALDPGHVDDVRERHVVEDDVDVLRPERVLVARDEHLRRLAGGMVDRPDHVGALRDRRRHDAFLGHEIVEPAAGHIESPDGPGRLASPRGAAGPCAVGELAGADASPMSATRNQARTRGGCLSAMGRSDRPEGVMRAALGGHSAGRAAGRRQRILLARHLLPTTAERPYPSAPFISNERSSLVSAASSSSSRRATCSRDH